MMKQLIYIALISTGLISQPVVLAMSQMVGLSSSSQSDNAMVMDDAHSMMTMQMVGPPASLDMELTDVMKEMPCHQSSAKGIDVQDCNDCCDSSCLAAIHCLTSCTVSPFVVNQTSSFAHTELVKVISSFLVLPTHLRRPSVIFHPPKYS